MVGRAKEGSENGNQMAGTHASGVVLSQREKRLSGGMMEEIKCNVETGEIEGSRPLSALASEEVARPDYWRDSTRDALESNIGPEFMAAFMAVQQKVGGVIEKDNSTAKGNKKKGNFDYDYTSLGAVMARVIKVMHEEGLVLQQYPGKIHGLSGNSKVLIAEIHTRITHAEKGQYQIVISPIPIENLSYNEEVTSNGVTTKTKKFTDIITPQSFGKSLTYGKRYALLSYWGIATEDKERINPLLESLNEPEYERIAKPIINGMNACESVQQLEEWGVKNSSMVRNVIHPKASRLISGRYKELQESLPATLPEDENQDTQVEELKKTVKKSKVKSDQMDLEEFIEETAA